MRILITICFLSLIAKSQKFTEFEKINTNYKNYIKKSFLNSFKKEEKETVKPLIFGSINRDSELVKVKKEKSFSISSFNQDDKLMAAILYGIKYFSTYEFVADDYERYNGSKDIIMKEFLKIKIFIIPDTNSMKKTNQLKINTLETLTQYRHNKLIYLKKPIIILHYSNHEETTEGFQKSFKTIISHKNEILYNSYKKGEKNILMHNSKMNEFMFLYRFKNKSELISGGLMNNIFTKFLCEIKNNIHLRAIKVSNVSDIYKGQLLDLKRISDRGRLTISQNMNYKLIL